MKKHTVQMVFSLIIVLLLLGIALSLRRIPPQPVRAISLILHTKTTAGGAMLQAGAQRAADEYKVDLSVITLTETGDAEEQQRLVTRELAGGAQAIILSCADMDAAADAAAACAQAGVPLLTITSGSGAPVTAHLSADQYAMGRDLALELLQRDGSFATISIIGSAANRTYLIERLQGLCSTFDAHTLPYELVDTRTQDITDYSFLNRLRQRGTSSVIALDLQELEALDTVLSGEPIALYGFDTSDAVLDALDSGRIGALCLSDDFSLGFLAVQSASALLAGESAPAQSVVRYVVIDQDNMYNTRNQWLLFPLQR